LRLQSYDYSRKGIYFITICTKNSEDMFGNVIDGKMVLNDFGKVAEAELLQTATMRKNV